MVIRRKINTAFKMWKKQGWNGIKFRLHNSFFSLKQKVAYQKWIWRFDTLTNENRKNLRREIENLSRRPLISIVLPVYNVEEKFLRLCIESVRKQIYENWELCIADDFSPSPHVRRVLEEYAEMDDQIKIIFRRENGHISAASNSALEIATGEFCVLLDHDDELSEHALFYVAKEINEFPEVEMIYSDEDLISAKGRRFNPKFKPDWSRDYFYSGNLVTHLSAYKTEVLRKIGGFRVGFEGSQDYDLALRVVEEIPENHIRHIPKILYHWRVIKGSVALSGDEKPYAHDAARKAIREHLERLGKKADVEQTVYNLHRVRYELPKVLPKVSLILLANEEFEFTIRSIQNYIETTEYPNFEIILVSRKKTEKLKEFPKTVKIHTSKKGNEAEIYNSAVAETDGEILCFADTNLKPLKANWLRELVSFAIQKEIGVVGAKLLSKNETILFGGFIIGTKNLVSIAHQNFPRDKGGNITRNLLIGNYSAVSVSCMAVRRENFEKNGGFDAKNFPYKFFDVDFCLKLREENLRIIFTPYVELIQVDENKTLNFERKTSEQEKVFFKKKWRKFIENDPFYNPNLSKENGNFDINI